MTTIANNGGSVSRGFEEVRTEFERNFSERGEIGGAVTAYWRGEKVVDRWGGFRMPERDVPWNEDMMVVIMSTTKGLSAMTLELAANLLPLVSILNGRRRRSSSTRRT
ncbi:MAG: serine hydrolase [Pirellulales bacterium]